MITPITATFPALNFPKEVDYPTQEDWAAFSAAAELNYGILSGEWSEKSEEFKTQTNNLALQIQQIGENAIDAITLNSIADLKLNSNITRVDVLGYYIKGDGGGGTFYWDATSTEADNGGTIIQATGIATGRWKRIFNGNVSVKWFGAKGDGIVNDTVAIQKCLALTNVGKIIFPKGTYKVTSALSLNIWQYDIIGEQATIDMQSLTGVSYALSFNTSNDLVLKHSISNITFLGSRLDTVDFIDLSLAGSTHFAHVDFNKIVVYNFRNQLCFGRNSSHVFFQECKFYHDGTNYRQGSAIYIDTTALVNSGEQLSFSQCQFGGNKYVVEDTGGLTAAQVNLAQCSLDYFNQAIKTKRGGVTLSQCSIESDIHTSEWFITEGDSEIIIKDSTFVIASTALSNYLFKALSTVVFGGITVKDCTYYINPNATITIDCFSNKTQYGKLDFSNFKPRAGVNIIPIGLNYGSQLIPFRPDNTLFKNLLLPYGDDASILTTDSILLFNGNSTTAITSTTANIKRKLRIDRGKYINLFAGYIYFYSTTNDGVQFTLTFYNGDNVALSSVVMYSTNPTENTWTKVSLNWYPMPPTNWAYATLDIFGAISNRKLNIGEIVING